MMKKVKTLFLASNPASTQPLKLDEEIRSITEKIRASEYRESLELVSLWAVRPDDLLQSLNEQKPTIVHFSGHGSDVGEIILMDTNRQPKPVSPQALKMLFATLKDKIRVVVLNACFSKIQANAIAEVVDCVIGMNTSIGDDAAITFAASFYRALGFGRSIKEAFDQGKTAIMLEGIPEGDTPELLVRTNVDPTSLLLFTDANLERTVNTRDKIASIQPIDFFAKISQIFNIDELKTICFNLGVDFESIPGATKESVAREMIGYFQRRGQFDLLVMECRKQRPNTNWYNHER